MQYKAGKQTAQLSKLQLQTLESTNTEQSTVFWGCLQDLMKKTVFPKVAHEMSSRF